MGLPNQGRDGGGSEVRIGVGLSGRDGVGLPNQGRDGGGFVVRMGVGPRSQNWLWHLYIQHVCTIV